MVSKTNNPAALKELLLQMMETGIGGMSIYTTAMRCTDQPDRKAQWQAWLKQAGRHQEIISDLCHASGVDPSELSAGRTVAKHLGEGLTTAMKMALAIGDSETVQRVACECVLLAETRQQQNWAALEEAECTVPGPLQEAINARVKEAANAQARQVQETAKWLCDSWRHILGQTLMPTVSTHKRDLDQSI
ncbi:hypothetical protein [Ottowia thiooxydans]|uniref:hypothetical protein n=1 Tax=Ottowia thiooxydans TaxID=219182 RepID=UPI0004211124|nr:hypothetical protein [Ottowia thiooxydans]